tara:strand:- start:3374 stop:4576 length:1203 start_codon:yes stop_codon:yes gene_type:complete
MMKIPKRRFGRTEIEMPVLSLGGMRFQKSWKDLDVSEISPLEQKKVNDLMNLAIDYGFEHVETARHYGSSELQLGNAIKNMDSRFGIIQTKIPPNNNIKIFEEELKISFENLGIEKINLVSIHGINTDVQLNQSLKDNGCIDVLKKWQNNNLIGNIGFSTHGNVSLIEKAISSNKFDYVNLHWYFVNQTNARAIELAKQYDLGVFIISPTDKGGHLYSPSEKFFSFCKPLHPIVFNDLFCLANEKVHTISVGIAKESDFDYHLEAVSLLSKAKNYIPEITNRLQRECMNVLGYQWYIDCFKNLPDWQSTPGNINIPVLIWLSNLVEAWDMVEFAKSRYQILGNAGHWFPGNNANELDINVSEKELLNVIDNHIDPKKVIKKLRSLKERFSGDTVKRLSKY